MNIPNAITASRIVLAPVLFLVYFLPLWSGVFLQGSIVLIWIVFLYIEFSDMVDGELARRTNQVSDMGKVLDPFADVIAHLTCFLVLVASNLMPVWAFIIIMYREFGIVFIRLLMYRKGVALAARKGGKAKTVTYAIAVGSGFLLSSFQRAGMFEPEGALGLFTPLPLDAPAIVSVVSVIALAAFTLAALLSLLSFIDYLRVFRNTDGAS
ncbi:MAG: CDP-diacylglycerol--glycerol-3-phosphate 3-phosphatidyltransferase [bacterium]